MRGAPLVVYALIAANLAVFALELRATDPNAFVDAFAFVPYDLTNNVVLAAPSPPLAVLTAFTALFVHAGFAHVGGNMLFLLVFGPPVEALCGHRRFAAYYLVCGLAGWLATTAVAPGSHVPVLGASGAIAGVLGGYVVTFPFAHPVRALPFPALLFIGVWALAQFLNGFGSLGDRAAESQGGTAYFAHIGGFCAGVLLSGLLRRKTGMRAW